MMGGGQNFAEKHVKIAKLFALSVKNGHFPPGVGGITTIFDGRSPPKPFPPFRENPEGKKKGFCSITWGCL